MNIPEKIKITRSILKENQTEFGKRFDVTATAVSLWEKGIRQAPYEVITFVVGFEGEQWEWKVCDKCLGKGYISVKHKNK